MRATPKISLKPTHPPVQAPAREETPTAPPIALPEPREPAAPVPVTQAQLQQAWAEYAESIRQQKSFAYQTLTQFAPVLKADQVIELPLANLTIQTDLLKDVQPALLAHLRRRLQTNFQIMPVAAPAEAESQKKQLYTPSDKFNFLAEKNPLLKDLKQMLNLDLGF